MKDFTVEATENHREMTLSNGNKIHFERKDPYGFWFVHYDKGPMPDKLQGAYTSFDSAQSAVLTYLNTKKLEPDAPIRSGRGGEQLPTRTNH